MKFELHCHTRFSSDSIMGFYPLYFKCRLCGIDAIAITEHNNLVGAKKFLNFCNKRGKKLLVVCGEEIMTNEGEIIGLFLDEVVPEGLTPEETIKRIKIQNGIVYVPHPYDEKRYKTVLDERFLADCNDLIDCVEIYNGRNISELYGERQKQIALKYNLKEIVGSDSHTVWEIGRNYIEVESIPRNSDEFRLMLENAVFITRPCITFAHYITKFAKGFELIKKGKFGEVLRSIVRRNQ